MPIDEICHRGTDIFVMDYRGCATPDELAALFEQAKRWLTAQPLDSVAVLTLTNGKVRMTGEVRKIAAAFAAATQAYTRCSAIVGLGPAQRLLVKLLSPKAYVSGDEAAARDWLGEQMAAGEPPSAPC